MRLFEGSTSIFSLCPRYVPVMFLMMGVGSVVCISRGGMAYISIHLTGFSM